MKRIEITYRSNINELNKLNARLERVQKTYKKKLAVAEKLEVANWTKEQYIEWISNVETNEGGWIINKADIKKNGAWRDLHMAESEVKDIQEKIEKAEKQFTKVEYELDKYHEEIAKEEDLKRKEELVRLEFEQEQKEWAKDGITLTSRYTGITPKGRRFWIERNHGWTERSFHCYTLTLTNDEGLAYTVFTSGEFWRAYGVVKNS